MKNLNFIFFCILFHLSANLLAQESVTYYEIQYAKEKNAEFQEIPLMIEKTNRANDMKEFINSNEVDFIKYVPLKAESLSAFITINLPLKGITERLELIEVTSDYKVVTSEGDTYSSNKKIKHYQGIVHGKSGLVSLSFYEDQIMGSVSLNNENFSIVKDKLSDKHLIFSESNLKEKSAFDCCTPDFTDGENSFLPVHDAKILFEKFSPMAASSDVKSSSSSRYVRFYAETEYDMYQQLRSYEQVEYFVSSLFNNVNLLYKNEGIITALHKINIWFREDPFTAFDRPSLLQQYQNTRTTIDGDLGILLTFRGIGGGRAAGFSGLTSPNVRDKLAICLVDNNNVNFPVYSWNVFAVTHELGHLFGSRHTHACVWNGNNTAIDNCALTEGGCNSSGLPAGGGTIMSYCHKINGVGINFNLGFGPQPGNIIRYNYNSTTFLNPLPPVNSFNLGNYGEGLAISPCPNEEIYITPIFQVASSNVSQGQWQVNGCTLLTSSNFLCRIKTPGGIYATFSVKYRYRTIYGWTEWATILGTNRNCNAGEDPFKVSVYNVFPNPVNDVLTIKLSHQSESLVSQTVNSQNNGCSIKLYNENGIIVRDIQSSDERIRLSVSSFPDGLYYLYIYKEGVSTPNVHKVIIKH